MVKQPMRSTWKTRFLPSAWLLILAVFGGASRADEWPQVPLAAAAVIVLIVSLWTPDVADLRAKRILWILLAATAVAVSLQLVPLPPAIWRALPGREPFLPSGSLSGSAMNWRAASLTPDLTWASLCAIIPVAATLAAAPTARSAGVRPLLWTMVAIFSVATLLGVVQTLGVDISIYRITNSNSAIGIFANRNHHAIFLSMAFPVLAHLVATERPAGGGRWLGLGIAVPLGVLYAVSIVQAGSRLGLVLATLMLCAVFILASRGQFPLPRPSRLRRNGADSLIPRRRIIALAGFGAAVATAAMVAIIINSVAYERIVQFDVTYDLRSQVLPLLLRMARAFMPLGSGYGSFATVFRQVEPARMLELTYLNQAHNDVLQVVIEGGLAGVVLMLAVALLWLSGTIRILRQPCLLARTVALVGSMIVGALLLASFADYPLRTPMLAAMLTYAAALMLPLKDENDRSGDVASLLSQGRSPREPRHPKPEESA